MDGCNEEGVKKKTEKEDGVEVDSDEEMIMNSNEDFWPEP